MWGLPVVWEKSLLGAVSRPFRRPLRSVDKIRDSWRVSSFRPMTNEETENVPVPLWHFSESESGRGRVMFTI